ncbi:YcbK family protein [Microvirga thermotolerans]|nr:D-Ala-D-Ala carboxypeptidase family metallohydrolase [Microvirga thermotolerans]
MSAVSAFQRRSNACPRRACCAACLAGALLAGVPGPALAEGEGTSLPAAQYASLPAAERMTDPAATGNLPGSSKPPVPPSRFSSLVAAGSILPRPGAPTGCLPAALRDVVADLSAKFGAVSIESTHRSVRRNRRAGGADHSLHLACRAMDLRIHNRARGVMAYLRSRPEIGGLKIYRNGIIHIDNGSRRHW